MKQKINCGFHLIELLITLFVIAILTAISMPLYSQYIVHERRLEAITELTQLALAMETYHIAHNTFENANLQNLHFKPIIAHSTYHLRIDLATLHTYHLSAEPIGKQAALDTKCATLTLNATGEKGITGKGPLADCW